MAPAATAQLPVDTARVTFNYEFWPWLQRQDEPVLWSVYRWEYRALVGPMRVLDATSYVLFYAAPFVHGATALAVGDRDDLQAAYRLAMSEGVAYVAQRGLKKVFRRARPFYVIEELPSKSIRYPDPADIFSFPSGHATASFTIASSIAWSYPEWYVILPIGLWASGVSISRVWLGVHYPSDILAGALLGTGIGTGVHLLRRHITPGFLRRDEAAPGSRIVIRFALPLN